MILLISFEILSPFERTFGYDVRPSFSLVHVNYYLLPVHGGRITFSRERLYLDAGGVCSETYQGFLFRGGWKIEGLMPFFVLFYEKTDRPRIYPDFGIEAYGKYWRMGTRGIFIHPGEIFLSLHRGKEIKAGCRISYREGWGLEGRGGIGFYIGSMFLGMGASFHPFTASIILSFPAETWDFTLSVTEHPELGKIITTNVAWREYEGEMP